MLAPKLVAHRMFHLFKTKVWSGNRLKSLGQAADVNWLPYVSNSHVNGTQEKKMKRRFSLLLGAVLLVSLMLAAALISWKKADLNLAEASPGTPAGSKLAPPANGQPITVAFVL